MKKKVFVAISGGVDSAVSAYLMQKKGYDVTGVFMKNWSGEDYGIEDQCPWRRDLEDSIEICKTLGISHKTYNFEKEYRSLVIDNFFKEYQAGHTPNPDVLCNKFVKFGLFYNRALEEGADFIATGHYAISRDGKLFKGIDSNKDQSYFLYQLKEEILKKTFFPVGDMSKKEVRKFAESVHLPVASKKDSQGICFVGKINVQNFIEQELGNKTGNFIDIDNGKKVGTHDGYWFYTIGQRKGIKIGGSGLPYYVCSKDILKNIVYLAKGSNNKNLYSKIVYFRDLSLINGNENEILNRKLDCSIRYRSVPTPAQISKEDDIYRAEFDRDVFAPAVGQSIVIYKGDRCYGGGIIKSHTLR